MYGGGLEGGSPIGYQQTTNYLASTNAGTDPNQGGAAPGRSLPRTIRPGNSISGAHCLSTRTAATGRRSWSRIGRRGQWRPDGGIGSKDSSQVMSSASSVNYPPRWRSMLTLPAITPSSPRGMVQWLVTYPPAAVCAGAGPFGVRNSLNSYYDVFSDAQGGCGQSPTIPALALLLALSQYCGLRSASRRRLQRPHRKELVQRAGGELTKRVSHGLTLTRLT